MSCGIHSTPDPPEVLVWFGHFFIFPWEIKNLWEGKERDSQVLGIDYPGWLKCFILNSDNDWSNA